MTERSCHCQLQAIMRTFAFQMNISDKRRPIFVDTTFTPNNKTNRLDGNDEPTVVVVCRAVM